MGQASPQPMVTTASAARTTSSVKGLGNSLDRSMPHSSIAATTAGLIRSAGSEPAERTWTLPLAWWSSSAAAICERPALCTHTNSTSGTSFMIAPSAWAAAREAPLQALGPRHRADDVGGDQGAVGGIPHQDGVRPCQRDERGRRRGTGSQDVPLVVVGHDQDLELAVGPVRSGNPVRIEDLHAFGLLAGARHAAQ